MTLVEIYHEAYYNCRALDGGRESHDECHLFALFAVWRDGVAAQRSLSLSSPGNTGTGVTPEPDNSKPLRGTDMTTATYGKRFFPGDKVECYGNKQGRVIGYYSTMMVEVRLWDGLRHVGDVCVPETDLRPQGE